MNTNARNIATILLCITLALLCINLVYVAGPHARNNILICWIVLSPLALLCKDFRTYIPLLDTPLLLAIASLVTFPYFFHPEVLRPITVAYTLVWCVFLMMSGRVIKASDITPSKFTRYIRLIVYAYAAMLIVQQISVMCGISIVPKIYTHTNNWKLPALNTEPGLSSLTLAVIIFYYSMTQRYSYNLSFINELKSHWPVWVCYLWVLFSTPNASAYIFFPLSLTPWISKRNLIYCATGFCIALAGIYITSEGNSHNKQLQRLNRISHAIITLNEDSLFNADPSIADRIVPTLHGIERISYLDDSTFVGHGVDADITQTPMRPCGSEGSAGLFKIWYNYGAVCALIFWIMIIIVTLIPGKWVCIVPMTLALFESQNYNCQVLWLILFCALMYNKMSDSAGSIFFSTDSKESTNHHPNISIKQTLYKSLNKLYTRVP